MRTGLFHCAALLICVVALVAVARYLVAIELFDPAELQGYVRERPVATGVAFVAVYAVCVLSFVPTLPLNLTAGLLWGGMTGGLLSALGVTLGSIAAFLVARVLLGAPLVERFQKGLPAWLRTAVNGPGWRAVAFCRLNPVVPTCVVNYAFGATALSLRVYAWTTLVFFLPVTLAIAVIGEQTQTFITSSTVSDLTDPVMVTLAAVSILLAISWAARSTGSVAGGKR